MNRWIITAAALAYQSCAFSVELNTKLGPAKYSHLTHSSNGCNNCKLTQAWNIEHPLERVANKFTNR